MTVIFLYAFLLKKYFKSALLEDVFLITSPWIRHNINGRMPIKFRKRETTNKQICTPTAHQFLSILFLFTFLYIV